MLKMKFMGADRKDPSWKAFDQHGSAYAGLCRERRNINRSPKEYPGDDVYSRWVPHWPPAGYALVIEVPMLQKPISQFGCPEVPLPRAGPKAGRDGQAMRFAVRFVLFFS